MNSLDFENSDPMKRLYKPRDSAPINSAKEAHGGLFKLKSVAPVSEEITNSPDQDAAKERIRDFLISREPCISLVGPAGAGKCLSPETMIAMADGSIRRADEIHEGDVLLGDDGTFRNVLARKDGVSPLYKIKPVRKGYDEWVCNDQHILTLVASYSEGPFKRGCVYNIGIQEYLLLKKSHKHNLKQFSVGFDGWDAVDFPIDPYMIGVWLGDGSTAGPTIWSVDKEVIDYVYEFGASVGMDVNVRAPDSPCPGYAIVNGSGKPHFVLEALREFGAGVQKTIPAKYLKCSRHQRLQLLAGILDTDGYLDGTSIEVAQKSVPLSDAICFLARSLGLRIHRSVKIAMGNEYQRMLISGDMSEIPFKVPRRIPINPKPNRNPLRSGFSVTDAGVGPYVGLVVDGNNLFLKSDFTVVHNTTILKQILEEAKAKKWYVSLSAPTHQAAARIREATSYPAETTHRILGVSLVRDEKTGKQYLKARGTPDVAPGTVMVIDEASMLPDQLLEIVLKFVKRKKGKVIFVGDAAQLNPVKEKPSKTVDRETCPWELIELTTIHRQAAENPIIALATAIRLADPWKMPAFETNMRGKSGIQHMSDKREWADFMVQQCGMDDFEHRYLAYTNRATDEAAKAVRRNKYGAEAAADPYLKGEVLVVNSRCIPDDKSGKSRTKKKRQDQVVIQANETVVVKNVWRDGDFHFVECDWHGHTVVLKAFDSYHERERYLESLRKSAILRSNWAEFFEASDSIADLRSAVSLTVHSSQGSTFDNVFINLSNMSTCRNREERQRLLYVAVTRASGCVYVCGELS